MHVRRVALWRSAGPVERPSPYRMSHDPGRLHRPVPRGARIDLWCRFQPGRIRDDRPKSTGCNNSVGSQCSNKNARASPSAAVSHFPERLSPGYGSRTDSCSPEIADLNSWIPHKSGRWAGRTCPHPGTGVPGVGEGRRKPLPFEVHGAPSHRSRWMPATAAGSLHLPGSIFGDELLPAPVPLGSESRKDFLECRKV